MSMSRPTYLPGGIYSFGKDGYCCFSGRSDPDDRTAIYTGQEWNTTEYRKALKEAMTLKAKIKELDEYIMTLEDGIGELSEEKEALQRRLASNDR